MRHNKVGRRLGRSASHRKATLSALSTALIKHKRIRTTLAKARETRRIIEPMITRARNAYLQEQEGTSSVHSRREIAKVIQDKEVLQMLFSDVAEKVGKRPGGYTRVLKLGKRLGDGADMAIIELVDYNTAQDDKSRRARVAGQKKADERKKRLEGQRRKAKEEEAEVEETAEETAAAATAETAESAETAEGAETAKSAEGAEEAKATEGTEEAKAAEGTEEAKATEEPKADSDAESAEEEKKD